jgi:chemotaxis protein methyltransferase CheR
VDVLLLRNVLLYFDLETRREILSRVRQVLRPDGVLVLGATESTLAVDRAFEAVRVDRTTCFKLRSTAA